MEVKKEDPYSACSSCGYLAVHASPVPKPARVREKITPEGLTIIIDDRNTLLGALFIGTLIFSFSVFAWFIFHDPEMKRMPAQLKEMIREESIIFIFPLLTGLITPIAIFYFSLTMMVNRKVLAIEKGILVRSAAPLPPCAFPFRLPLADVKGLEVEYTKNYGYSLQALTYRDRKITIWPTDTNPLMLLYLKEQVKDSMEMQALREGNPLQRDFSKALDDEDCDRLLTMLDGHPELANGRSAGGRTPLTLAADRGNLSLAKMLLGIGAEVNMADRREHRTALHYACLKGHAEMVELLLAHKADVSPTDREKATPLHLAKAGRA
jgi:hypothetical protein